MPKQMKKKPFIHPPHLHHQPCPQPNLTLPAPPPPSVPSVVKKKPIIPPKPRSLVHCSATAETYSTHVLPHGFTLPRLS